MRITLSFIFFVFYFISNTCCQTIVKLNPGTPLYSSDSASNPVATADGTEVFYQAGFDQATQLNELVRIGGPVATANSHYYASSVETSSTSIVCVSSSSNVVLKDSNSLSKIYSYTAGMVFEYLGGCPASSTYDSIRAIDADGGAASYLNTVGCGFAQNLASSYCTSSSICSGNGGCAPQVACTPVDNTPTRTCPPCSSVSLSGDSYSGTCTSNPCASGLNPCSSLVTCTNVNNAAQCGPCPTGYVGNGKTCTPNPCATNNGGCSPQSNCSNSNGVASCSACNYPYIGSTGNTVGGTCYLNQCTSKNGGCDPLTQCTPTSVGAPVCSSCPPFYDGTGTSGCIPHNYCLSTSICPAGALCINTAGVAPGYVCGPAFVPLTLRVYYPTTSLPPSSPVYPLQLLDAMFTSSSSMVALAVGVRPATSASVTVNATFITYNDNNNGMLFPCLSSTLLPVSSQTAPANTSVCVLPSGLGLNLQLAMSVCVSGSSHYCTTVVSPDTFNYPLPFFVPNTIMASSGTAVSSSSIVGATALSETLTFRTHGFFISPNVALASVKYGPYTCMINVPISNSTTLVCSTKNLGAGGPYNFTYTGPTGVAVTSYDTYSYPPNQPSISSISGCPLPGASAGANGVLYTAGCATVGGTLLTMNGAGFALQGTSVFVNGVSCTVQSVQSFKVVCTMPPGVGTSLSVVVSSNGQFSAPAILSYAPPSITGLMGCLSSSSVSLQLSGCLRGYPLNNSTSSYNVTNVLFAPPPPPSSSFSTITIFGTNFGSSGATVLLGSSQCLNVTHSPNSPNEMLTCIVPPGAGSNIPVLVLQLNGLLSISAATSVSASAMLSYSPCVPGTVVYGNTCLMCAAGYFTDSYNADKCLPCLPGTVTATAGLSICAACPPGSYSLASSSSCLNCTAGSYSSSSRQQSCTGCSPGTFVSASGSTTCEACPLGMYQSNSSATKCAVCEMGYFASTQRQTSCDHCPGGTQGNATGLTACYTCNLGYFSVLAETPPTSCIPCTPGHFGSISGQTACSLCASGSFASGYASTTCLGCAMGSAAPQEGSSSCQQCTPGTWSVEPRLCRSCGLGMFASNYSSSICERCQPGTFAPSIGTSSCVLCGLGYSTPGPGASQCTICPVGSAAPIAGSPQCYPCGANMVTNSQRSRCSCLPGSFANITSLAFGPSSSSSPTTVNGTSAAMTLTSDNTPSASLSLLTSFTCISCPVGADCTSPTGTTFDTLLVSPGYWRRNNMTLDFEPCILAGQCPGGAPLQCALGRVGVICALCDKGYNGDITQLQCAQCPSRETSITLVVFFTALIVVALLVMYGLMLRGTSDVVLLEKKEKWSLSVSETMSTSETNANNNNYGDDQHSPSSKTPTADAPSSVTASLLDSNTETGVDVLTVEHRSPISFTYTLKIVVSFLQIATSIASISHVYWPSAFLTFIGVFDFVNLNLIPWTTMDCIVSSTFYQKLYVIALVPLALLLCLALFYYLPLFVLDRRDLSDDDSVRARRHRHRHNFVLLVLFTLFLLYPGVSRMVLNSFVCHSVGDTTYLVADFNLFCYDSVWYQQLGPVIVLLLLYPIGIPLFFFLLLFYYHSRHLLSSPSILRSVGFLYSGYRSSCWWFELVDMFHKLLLTCTIVFWPPTMQMPVAMIVSVVYTTVLLLVRPYVRKFDDRLHLFAQCEILLLIMSAYVMNSNNNSGGVNNQPAPGSPFDVFMSVILIASVVLLCLLFVGHVIISVRTLIWSLRRRRMMNANKQQQEQQQKQRQKARQQMLRSEGQPSISTGPLTQSVTNRASQGQGQEHAQEYGLEMQPIHANPVAGLKNQA